MTDPAFPVIYRHEHPHEHGTEVRVQTWPGMTLRDYFAAKAMQGILSSEVDTENGETSVWFEGKINSAKLASFSFQVADAMLKEREKDD